VINLLFTQEQLLFTQEQLLFEVVLISCD